MHFLLVFSHFSCYFSRFLSFLKYFTYLYLTIPVKWRECKRNMFIEKNSSDTVFLQFFTFLKRTPCLLLSRVPVVLWIETYFIKDVLFKLVINGIASHSTAIQSDLFILPHQEIFSWDLFLSLFISFFYSFYPLEEETKQRVK